MRLRLLSFLFLVFSLFLILISVRTWRGAGGSFIPSPRRFPVATFLVPTSHVSSFFSHEVEIAHVTASLSLSFKIFPMKINCPECKTEMKVATSICTPGTYATSMGMGIRHRWGFRVWSSCQAATNYWGLNYRVQRIKRDDA